LPDLLFSGIYIGTLSYVTTLETPVDTVCMCVWTKFGYMIWTVYLERDGKHAWAVLKYLEGGW